MFSWAAFLKTIILLGTVQGFIVSSLLFFSKRNKRSNHLLAWIILLITLACFNLYGTFQNWFNIPILAFLTQLVPLVIIMPVGPLIYFYVQSSVDPAFKITKRERRQFYPVLIDLVPSLTVLLFIGGVLTKLIRNNPGPWGNFIDDYNVYADIPRWMSVGFYSWLSAKYLRTYTLNHNRNLNGHTAHVKWLRQFIGAFIVFQVIWLVYLIPYVIPKYTNMMLDTFDWYPLYIPLAVLIYWLGIKGYMASQQQVMADKKAGAVNTTLSSGQVEEVIAILTKLMKEDKLYLNPNLNLSTVAEAGSFPPKTISAVLNQHLRTSFNEFVNSYRVNEFKERIVRPELNNLTIAGIALECGFNSQATFQRTFKELTGQSPSAYRKMAASAG